VFSKDFNNIVESLENSVGVEKKMYLFGTWNGWSRRH